MKADGVAGLLEIQQGMTKAVAGGNAWANPAAITEAMAGQQKM